MLDSTTPDQESATCVVESTFGHQAAAQELMCDLLTCCFYVLDAGGFWQSREVCPRLMCENKSGYCYVLSAGGFWRSKDAWHRFMCDNPS